MSEKESNYNDAIKNPLDNRGLGLDKANLPTKEVGQKELPEASQKAELEEVRNVLEEIIAEGERMPEHPLPPSTVGEETTPKERDVRNTLGKLAGGLEAIKQKAKELGRVRGTILYVGTTLLLMTLGSWQGKHQERSEQGDRVENLIRMQEKMEERQKSTELAIKMNKINDLEKKIAGYKREITIMEDELKQRREALERMAKANPKLNPKENPDDAKIFQLAGILNQEIAIIEADMKHRENDIIRAEAVLEYINEKK